VQTIGLPVVRTSELDGKFLFAYDFALSTAVARNTIDYVGLFDLRSFFCALMSALRCLQIPCTL